jgi:hypothetical protein
MSPLKRGVLNPIKIRCCPLDMSISRSGISSTTIGCAKTGSAGYVASEVSELAAEMKKYWMVVHKPITVEGYGKHCTTGKVYQNPGVFR